MSVFLCMKNKCGSLQDGDTLATCLRDCRNLPVAAMTPTSTRADTVPTTSTLLTSPMAVDKRQGDQMNTCIEAKCAGITQPLYAKCIFNYCIRGQRRLHLMIGGKRTPFVTQIKRSPSAGGPNTNVTCTLSCGRITSDPNLFQVCMKLYCKDELIT